MSSLLFCLIKKVTKKIKKQRSLPANAQLIIALLQASRALLIDIVCRATIYSISLKI